MKLRNAIVALLAGALAVTSMAAVAQNQNREGDRAQQQVRERQVERATERDRTMQHERLQARDRDRVHAQEPTGGGEGDQDRQRDRDQDQDQVRDRDRIHQADASSATGGDIYGQNLMTEQERNRYREQLMKAGTPEEQEQLRARHREEMQKRAREQGVEIEEPEGE